MSLKRGYVYLVDIERQVLREADDFNPSYIRQAIHNFKIFRAVKRYFDEMEINYVEKLSNGRIMVNPIFGFYMKCRLVDNLDSFTIDTILNIIKDGLDLQDVECYREFFNMYMQGGLYCFEAMTAFLVAYQKGKTNGKGIVFDKEVVAKDIESIFRHSKNRSLYQRKKCAFGNSDAFLAFGDRTRLGE